MIVAEQLTKVYPGGAVGLGELSLRIEPGELVGIVGPSGAGKTTLLRLLNGALRPTSGSLSVLGHPLSEISGSKLRDLRRRIAVVYQHHNLIPSLSVLQNVLIGRAGGRSLARTLLTLLRPSEMQWQQVYQLLAELGVGDQIDARVEELSGGQQQRVAIARALYCNADLILADEPIASVDARSATTILDRLERESKLRGRTVVLNLHQVGFALRYCQRVLVLDRGRLVCGGDPAWVQAWLTEEGFFDLRRPAGAGWRDYPEGALPAGEDDEELADGWTWRATSARL